MDPVVDNDWLSCKNDPVDEAENVGNFVRSCQWRELGLDPPHSLANKAVLENMAEDRLVQKQLKFRSCDLPDTPRSTFLIVFSPDGTKIASTHLNHNIYISELATGKHVKILKGHPRTPWSIGFHPSHPHLIGSGCLGGQVRVWDLSGGSEVWTAGSGAVIASVAFHPRDQLLVVATLNELYFWDWSQPAPFTKVCTNNINEKVKYVAFDALGHKLITGISVWGSSGAAALQHAAGPPAPRRDPPAAADGSAQEMIVNSYQNLVQRYDNLVRNYQRLFMARHELSNAPPSNTTDRGTDPMETDAAPPQWTRVRRAAERAWRETEGSSRRTEGSESADLDNPSSRLLNLGVLSIRSNPPRYNMEVQTNAERTVFGSRTSAFQRLNDYPERLGAGSAERSRWLPNPFSSSTAPRSNSSSSQTQHDASGSRTSSAFSSLRMGSDAYIIRNYLARQAETRTSPPADRPSTSHDDAGSSRTRAINTLRDFVERDDSPLFRQNVHPRSGRGSRRSTSPSRRPTDRTDRPDRQTDGPAAEPPHISPAAAQTINESLDLIRDILRDSGTRLLNLITNMSLSTLASVEHGAHSPPRPRVRLFSSNLRRDLISSESESDSDPSLEVNVLRRSTPPRDPAPGARPRPTNRMLVDLHHMDDDDDLSSTNFLDSLNVSVSNSRFRVRSHSTDEPRAPGRRRRSPPTPRATPPLPGRRRRRSPPTPPATPPLPGRRSRSPSTPRATPPLPDRRSLSPPTPRATSPLPDPSRPSTSADTSWMQDRSSDRSGPATPSREAYRKVKAGVIALQKHTAVLTDLWGRGYRATTRDLRLMWEALRRRVLLLHRQTGRDPRGYYTRGLMERCRLLTELTRSVPRRTRREFLDNEDSQHTQMSTDSTSSSLQTEPEPPSPRPRPAPRRSQPPTASLIRSAQQRRRLQTTYRWRHEDEARRRSRWQPRAPRPSRRDSRSFDLQCTRNDIRMRAMQVLSIMFNMMMNCLEERGLSQLIIVMLRALKRALTLTCLMLMTNRLNRDREGSSNRNDGASEEAGASRQEPGAGSTREGDGAADNNTTINNETGERTSNTGRLDDNDSNSTSSWPTSDSDEEQPRKRRRADDGRAASRTAGRPRAPPAPRAPHAARPPRAPAPRWSNRLAVQISAANRNTSLTARTRRDLYMESKRQKALHRTNPSVHPIARRRVQPPSSTSRIPTMRSLPPKPKTPEPTPGPSTSQAGPPEAPAREAEPAAAGGLDIEHRVNLFRIAHMHAVRLRSAARSRLRRLQTIRLYTPSAVREMFGLQSNNNEQGDGVGLAGLAGGARFAAYRPAAGGAGEGEAGAGGARFAAYRPAAEAGDAGALGAEAGEPAPLGEGPPLADAPDAPGPHGDGARPPLRMPRVLEYLQPIILSQNALVVEEGGALGSLLDAGLVGDALPASTHRVQAWDFAAGDLPDIADRKKNVVVPRCRIHNDASIDVSRDGRILVALLPVARLRNTNHWLGVYSLEWGRLGQCLHTAMLGQSVVSVALSPTARHLAVGFGSRRFTTLPHARNNVFALLYRLSSTESTSRTGLSPIKELEQNWELGVTSLNCLRWAPQPGQGLVYANNTGQLIVMS